MNKTEYIEPIESGQKFRTLHDILDPDTVDFVCSVCDEPLNVFRADNRENEFDVVVMQHSCWACLHAMRKRIESLEMRLESTNED